MKREVLLRTAFTLACCAAAIPAAAGELLDLGQVLLASDGAVGCGLHAAKSADGRPLLFLARHARAIELPRSALVRIQDDAWATLRLKTRFLGLPVLDMRAPFMHAPPIGDARLPFAGGLGVFAVHVAASVGRVERAIIGSTGIAFADGESDGMDPVPARVHRRETKNEDAALDRISGAELVATSPGSTTVTVFCRMSTE